MFQTAGQGPGLLLVSSPPPQEGAHEPLRSVRTSPSAGESSPHPAQTSHLPRNTEAPSPAQGPSVLPRQPGLGEGKRSAQEKWSLRHTAYCLPLLFHCVHPSNLTTSECFVHKAQITLLFIPERPSDSSIKVSNDSLYSMTYLQILTLLGPPILNYYI